MKTSPRRSARLIALSTSLVSACSLVGGFTEDRVLGDDVGATGAGGASATSSGAGMTSTTASASAASGGVGGAGGEASTTTTATTGVGGQGTGGAGGTGGSGPLGAWPDSATPHCEAPEAQGSGNGAGACAQGYCTVPCGELPAAFASQDGAVLEVEPILVIEGSVTVDEVTGLTWTRDVVDVCGAGEGGAAADSQDAAVACCEALDLDGETDWRLPRFRELVSLWDAGIAGAPALDPEAFASEDLPAGARYWTSDAAEDGLPVLVGFDPIDVRLRRLDETEAVLVRCVRGISHQPDPHDHTEGVVDRATGLEWPNEQPPSCMTWSDALSACDALGEGFRLATVKELATIVDPAESTNTAAGFSLPGSCARRWSSTPRANTPGRMFILQMSDTPTLSAGEISVALAMNAVASPVCVRVATE